MKIKLAAAVAIFVLATPPVVAQDLPTDQLDRHAETVRQDMLLKSTLRHSTARQNARSTPRVTTSQAAACAKKAQFRSEHGAGHPKVQKLYGLCRRVGL
jgi:hypothetical protein